jgi:hypothetical protein
MPQACAAPQQSAEDRASREHHSVRNPVIRAALVVMDRCREQRVHGSHARSRLMIRGKK